MAQDDPAVIFELAKRVGGYKQENEKSRRHHRRRVSAWHDPRVIIVMNYINWLPSEPSRGIFAPPPPVGGATSRFYWSGEEYAFLDIGIGYSGRALCSRCCPADVARGAIAVQRCGLGPKPADLLSDGRDGGTVRCRLGQQRRQWHVRHDEYVVRPAQRFNRAR